MGMGTVSSVERPPVSTLVNQPCFLKSVDFLTLGYVLWLLFIRTLLFGWNFMWNSKTKKLKEKQLWLKVELEEN